MQIHSEQSYIENRKYFSIRKKVSEFFFKTSKATKSFIQQFSVLLNAHLSISQSLHLLISQEKHIHIRRQYQLLLSLIQQGGNFSESMQKTLFRMNKADLQLIHFGESCGKFSEVMSGLSEEISQRQLMAQQCRKALGYPIFVFFTSVSISLFLLFYLIPMFADIFKASGANLPPYTQSLMQLSTLSILYGPRCLFIFFLLLGLSLLLMHKSPKGKYIYHMLSIYMPFIGTIKRMVLLKQICTLLKLCHQTGMTINQSLLLISQSCANLYVAKCLENASRQVKLGKKLSGALSHDRWIHPLVLQSISIAEETATLDAQLSYLSDYFKRRLDESILWLSQLAEPVLICLIGAMMGGMMVAMYLPLFQLGAAIS